MSSKSSERCGWFGNVSEFLSTDYTDWLTHLQSHHQRCMNIVADAAQVKAWRNCHTVLHQQLLRFIQSHANANEWTLIFEYELLRERGRRPDVVVLGETAIAILEFKDYRDVRQAHLDQASAYARDISHYHAASHQRPIRTVLLLTQASDLRLVRDEVVCLSPEHLPTAFNEFDVHPTGQPIDPASWLNAEYAPLPSLVSAARTIFQHEPLPQIRRAQSAGIPDTIKALVSIAAQAQEKKELHLALVTGVPGAGKTLVGLQFVYENHFAAPSNERAAVFLSGNGPLVKVLQHALQSRVFVQDVHGFLKEYGGRKTHTPTEHIWVYDEAQRAWDAGRVQEKRAFGVSEPEDFLRIGVRKQSWAFLVGLIGEGQEIHLGEEAGLEQWNDAIRAVNARWIVHCPPRIAPVFSAADEVITSEKLDLSVSLRAHLAEDVQTWIRLLLEGQMDTAKQISERIRGQGFEMYITHVLEKAKEYVRERYRGQLDKRYGLLASSKAKNLEQHHVRNGYNYTKNLREGPWYNDDPDSSRSCCQLEEVATEFACQGLELDFPIVCWGDDLIFNESRWNSLKQPRSTAKDPYRLRINSYRVLLSRGRDGFVVFTPPEPEMRTTYSALRQAGLVELL
jgi:DUF2075 family protein